LPSRAKAQILARLAEDLDRRSVWIRCGFICLISVALSIPLAAQTIDLFPGNQLGEWTRVAIPPDPLGNIDQWHTDPPTREIICYGNGGREWLRFNREFSNVHTACRMTIYQTSRLAKI
jgi:hypothetical protein